MAVSTFYYMMIRHELSQMETRMARSKIDDANRENQYKHARRAQQNATRIRNRNIASMQRTKRK